MINAKILTKSRKGFETECVREIESTGLCVKSFGSRLVVLISNTQAGALNLSN